MIEVIIIGFITLVGMSKVDMIVDIQGMSSPKDVVKSVILTIENLIKNTIYKERTHGNKNIKI